MGDRSQRNGTINTDYQTSVGRRVATAGTGAFRGGAAGATVEADFDQSYTAINSYQQGSRGGAYTVRSGDSLQSIAAALYGDSALWYKIAEANGISGNTALIEGQTLTLPAGVIRSSNNAKTFRPYDPSAAIGDLSPTAPEPQEQIDNEGKKGGKCGIFGKILLAVIAVAVAIALPGAGILKV